MASSQAKTSQPKRTRSDNEEDDVDSPVTRSELDAVLASLRGDIQCHVDQSTRNMQDSITNAFSSAVRQLDERNERRFLTLEADLSSTTTSLDKVEKEQASMWKTIRMLQQDLQTAEASAPLRDPGDSATERFDRKIDVTILKVNTKEMVAKDAMATVMSTLLEEADIRNDQYSIQGMELAKKFTIRFTGTAQTAERRANKVFGLLRREDGSWRKFTCPTPAQRECDLFIGTDKSPKQVKTEMEGKRLWQSFKDKYAHLNPHFLRKEGIIQIGWVPVAKLEIQPGEEPTQILWNNKAVSDHGIDKDALVASFRLFRNPSEPVVWHLHQI